jgi:adsorption protein B
MSQYTPLEWLALADRELLLFAGFFFLLGALDEFAVDLGYGWLRLTGRARDWRIERQEACSRGLGGPAALFIPAWREDSVIEHTLIHALAAWPNLELRVYVGCYRNDQVTLAAASRGASGDARVRVVVHDCDGPSTKADCLNRLYAALEDDEARCGCDYRLVLLHDAEDMVDPAALGLMDRALDEAEFVQLPVLPEPQAESRWISGHYMDEFAEAHAKALVVRQALGAALPAAGVGCGFSRVMLRSIARDMGALAPFSVDSLTEDYELGLRIKAAGGRALFLRVRGEDGRLVATRACFPGRIDHAVRQKARWIHGIALQGWDRMGLGTTWAEGWMRMRDRRGPLTALVLFVGYLLVLLALPVSLAERSGLVRPLHVESGLPLVLTVTVASFVWRAMMRGLFTAREYGWAEGLRAVLRIPVANVIVMMAARRALAAYVRSLRGAPLQWDKTMHHALPAALLTRSQPA